MNIKTFMKHFTKKNLIFGVIVICIGVLFRFTPLCTNILIICGLDPSEINKFVLAGFMILILKLSIKGLIEEIFDKSLYITMSNDIPTSRSPTPGPSQPRPINVGTPLLESPSPPPTTKRPGYFTPMDTGSPVDEQIEPVMLTDINPPVGKGKLPDRPVKSFRFYPRTKVSQPQYFEYNLNPPRPFSQTEHFCKHFTVLKGEKVHIRNPHRVIGFFDLNTGKPYDTPGVKAYAKNILKFLEFHYRYDNQSYKPLPYIFDPTALSFLKEFQAYYYPDKKYMDTNSKLLRRDLAR
jgi:hypothetical protein